MNLQNLHASPLVAAAKEARRPTRWWLAAIYAVIVGIIVAGTVGLGLYTSYVHAPEGSLVAQFGEIFSNAMALVALWLWLRFKEGRPFSSLGFRGGDALRRFLTGLVIGAGLLTLSVLSLRVLGDYQSVPGAAGGVSGWAALLPVLLVALVWLVQGSTEEILMRGYLVQTGGLQLPGWVAILIPALIFSGLHFSPLARRNPSRSSILCSLPCSPASSPCVKGHCGWSVAPTSAGTGFRAMSLGCPSVAMCITRPSFLWAPRPTPPTC